MTIQETITTEFNRIKEMISPILVDFNKYLEFLDIKDNGGVEYREFKEDGVDYIEITLSHEETLPKNNPDDENEKEKKVKVIDKVYTIIAFTSTTFLHYKTTLKESKETISALDILGEELTNMQKNYLVVAIAFETILDYLEEILTPSEDKDFLETMKELVNGVQL